MRPFVSRGLSFVLPALGVIAGYLVSEWRHPASTASQAGPTGSSVNAQRLELVDQAGRARILMAMSGIWLFDAQGKARLNLGLYGDGNAFVVVNDKQEHAVEILRSVGEQSAPVLVQKAQGRDRLILGLAGPSGDSFLVRYGESGAKQVVFGEY